MKKLIIEVADRNTVNERFANAAAGKAQGEYLTFESVEIMHKVLNPKRWKILKELQKQHMGLRELARQIEVNAGNLQRDLKPLKDFGIVVEQDNQLTVPYKLSVGHLLKDI